MQQALKISQCNCNFLGELQDCEFKAKLILHNVSTCTIHTSIWHLYLSTNVPVAVQLDKVWGGDLNIVQSKNRLR